MPTVPIEPQAWRPPPAPDLVGPYAPNRLLATAERWSVPGTGPADVTVCTDGAVACGLADGRIVRIGVDGTDHAVVARVPGRPLGIAHDPRGGLLVCSSGPGLVHVDPDGGTVTNLRSRIDDHPLRFACGLAVTPDGDRIYLTDASRRVGFEDRTAELLEHSGTGRLIVHDRDRGTAEVLLDGLYLPTGVALAADGSSLLVAESQRYRIGRLWIDGPAAGRRESFAHNLPGLPGGLSCGRDPATGEELVWVALPAPRDALLDRLLPYPGLRRALWALPAALQPPPRRYGLVLGLGAGGRVVHNLQDPDGRGFARISAAHQHAGHLFLGSLDELAVGRVAIPTG